MEQQEVETTQIDHAFVASTDLSKFDKEIRDTFSTFQVAVRTNTVNQEVKWTKTVDDAFQKLNHALMAKEAQVPSFVLADTCSKQCAAKVISFSETNIKLYKQNETLEMFNKAIKKNEINFKNKIKELQNANTNLNAKINELHLVINDLRDRLTKAYEGLEKESNINKAWINAGLSHEDLVDTFRTSKDKTGMGFKGNYKQVPHQRFQSTLPMPKCHFSNELDPDSIHISSAVTNTNVNDVSCDNRSNYRDGDNNPGGLGFNSKSDFVESIME